MSQSKRISVAKAIRLIEENPRTLILDMRNAEDYCRNRDPRAIHLNSPNLRSLLRNTPRELPVLVYCENGSASPEIARLFADFGFVACYSLEGGFDSWKMARAEHSLFSSWTGLQGSLAGAMA